MADLRFLRPSSENYDPNIQQFALQSLNQLRQTHQASMQDIMDDRETKSIHSGVTYNQSAIGEMNQQELD